MHHNCEWTEEFWVAPSCSRTSPMSKFNCAWVPVLFIHSLFIRNIYVRYYMRHQQQRFLPGANDFFSKVGSTWVDITWITDVLVWIDLWGPLSSPSPERVESSFPPRQSGFMYSKSVIQPRHHLGRIHIYWDGSAIPQTCLELFSWNLMRSCRAQGDFPSGPAVKTLHFQCRGRGFLSWLDN